MTLVENALIVVIVIAVALITDVAVLLLAKLFPRYRPTDVKMSRFEAGNPPLGIPKWTLPMQYIGFMIMFMAFEPILVLLLLFSGAPTLDVFALTILAFLLMLPAIYVAYHYSLEIAKLRGDVHG
ncbi:NADH-quinone oxidoreductase subunit A [Archaeoglobus neptunius]|uniref:NADH-quinone oxidoreductase subunit A n=1 Tax=Archaeoglobus neptunius TaxID=2798580 RepID=UPI001928DB59|nr:NADH-quinone oxidoreductase subunit A [Archaeoglobus neptunius]